MPRRYPPNALSLHSCGEQRVYLAACVRESNPFTVVNLLSSSVLPRKRALVQEFPERGYVESSTNSNLREGDDDDAKVDEVVAHCPLHSSRKDCCSVASIALAALAVANVGCTAEREREGDVIESDSSVSFNSSSWTR